MARFDRGRTRSRSEIRRRVRGSLLRFLPPSLPPHPRLGLDREESVNGVVPLASLQALTRFLYTAKPSRRRCRHLSERRIELSASLQVRVSRFLYRYLHACAYTHIHVHSARDTGAVCISLRFPRMSIISLQAHQSPSSFRGPPLSLYRAELASSRFRDVSPSSITPHIGLYHDPLVVETPATSCTDVTRIHTHTHTHDTHYFIGRNERLVLSFVLCTASRLVRVSCNVTRGRGDRREKNRRRKGGKEDGPSIIIHVYTRIFTYINTRTREFFLPFDSSIFVYIRVSLKRAPWCKKAFFPPRRGSSVFPVCR